MPSVYKKTLKCIGNNSLMSSPRVTFNLTCGKGVTELQNLTNLCLSSFADSHQMQQKNFDVSPKYANNSHVLGIVRREVFFTEKLDGKGEYFSIEKSFQVAQL